MKQYLREYIENIDESLKGEVTDEMIQQHLVKISFFQHERLIHLLVTLSYALFMLFSILLCEKMLLFIIVVLIVIIFLVFYVKHYFFLENGVQYLYKQYDKMLEKLNK